jgi:mycothiol synthase
MLPDGYTVRPPRDDDEPAAIAVGNACSREATGRDRWVEGEIVGWWRHPASDRERDHAVVCDPAGVVAAVFLSRARPPYVDLWSQGLVHPDHCGRGIGTYLLERGRARATERMASAPPGQRVVHYSGAPAANVAAAALFAAHGMAHARSFYEMVIAFDRAPAPAVWPDGVELHPYNPARDDAALHELLEGAFRDHWGRGEETLEEFQHELASLPEGFFVPELTVIAREGTAFVGASLVLGRASEDLDAGFVAALGVRRDRRGRGLGSALLAESLARLHAAGRPRARLQVDATSQTGANALYERAGMSVTQEYRVYEFELRPPSAG